MKPLILSTATILTASLIYSFPALAQSQRITCVRDRNVITCPNYGSFQYSSNNNNRSRANISCFRDQNVINCQNYGSFRYQSNNNNNENWSSKNVNQINDLYVQVLGRNANSKDLRNYSQTINNQGWSLAQARLNLANSKEFNQAINNVYREYLGRNADAGGLKGYRNAVINGVSFEAVRNEIANSPEALNRNQNNGNYNNNDYNSPRNNGNYNNGNYNRPRNNGNYNQSYNNANEINDLYVQVLGRNANANDLRNYNQSWSLAQARRNLVSSQEFNQAINNLYREYLGRNADAKGLQSYRNAINNGRSFEDVSNEIANSPEANDRSNNDNYNQPNGSSTFGDGVKDMVCQVTGLCF
jgi:hypothetical protein